MAKTLFAASSLGPRFFRSASPRAPARQRGFTLIELLITVGVVLIVSAMSLVQVQPLLQGQQSTAAMDQVVSQLRNARETAIAQRRFVQVQFIGTDTVQLTRFNLPTGSTILSTLPLEGRVQFLTFAGQPDTPDGFGNASAIEFGGIVGGPPLMQFQSDGTFVDGLGNPLDGTVFLGYPGQSGSARAITVFGATGRIRAYRTTSAGWIR